MKVWPVIILMSLLLSCSDTKVETKYYSNGNLKSKQELRDGKKDGIFEEYSVDGKIKRSGIATDGNIKELTYYYDSGKIFQVQHYDEFGNIVDAERFKEDGKRDSTAIPFFYISESDTVKKDVDIVFKAKMLNAFDSIYNNGQLIITSGFHKSKNKDLELLDTLAILYPKNRLDFEYKLDTHLVGENMVYGQFIFKKIAGNKLYMITHEFGYPYYVKN